jgi:hypothetical protein
MTPLIIMVGADKGGVGKTTVARAMDDYLRARTANVTEYDTETGAGDLKRFAPESQLVDIENVDDQMRIFDSIKGVTLIDIRAGLLSPTLHALNRVGLLDDVRSGALALAVLHVIGPSLSSLREIGETAAAIGGARHFLVKNFVSEGGFKEWEGDDRFAEQLKAAAARTITVPHLIDRACSEVQVVGGSFKAFADDASKSRMLRGYVRDWLAATFVQFDSVGLKALVSGAG